MVKVETKLLILALIDKRIAIFLQNIANIEILLIFGYCLYKRIAKR